jgi:hypothetical protein
MLFLDLFQENYKKPAVDELTANSGQYSSTQNQINRLMVGFMNEFLSFLKNNKNIFSNIRFKLIEKGLNITVKQEWDNILSVLDDKESDNFLSKIARIRSNIIFHYSGKELRREYLKYFFEIPKDERNKNAYYSLGMNMRSTQFYYCDAAVGSYLREHLKIGLEDSHFNKMGDLIAKTNDTIRFLMEGYLKYKISKK